MECTGWGRNDFNVRGYRACSASTRSASSAPSRSATLDEGLLSLYLSNLLYMENTYSYKKCQ